MLFRSADASFTFALPPEGDDVAAAPLLCAGLIGWRSLRMVGDGKRIGLYGFGAAAHIIAQVARWQGRRVFAFTRAGDVAGQEFARKLGAVWAGASDAPPPEPLHAVSLTTPPAAVKLSVVPPTATTDGLYAGYSPGFPLSPEANVHTAVVNAQCAS